MPAVDWAKQSVLANQLHGRTADKVIPNNLVEVVITVAGKCKRRRWPLGLISWLSWLAR